MHQELDLVEFAHMPRAFFPSYSRGRALTGSESTRHRVKQVSWPDRGFVQAASHLAERAVHAFFSQPCKPAKFGKVQAWRASLQLNFVRKRKRQKQIERMSKFYRVCKFGSPPRRNVRNFIDKGQISRLVGPCPVVPSSLNITMFGPELDIISLKMLDNALS